MDYTLYGPEDFAGNESYLRYYFRLNEKDIQYWEDWIRTHPEKLDVIVSADQLIAFLSLQLPEDEFQQEYERITKAIAQQVSPPVQPAIPLRPTPKTRYWLAAASLILLTGMVWWFGRAPQTPADKVFAGFTGKIRQQKNETTQPLLVWLADSSCITLQPGALAAWPVQFADNKREVYLQGAALFEVYRNTGRPFLVYCNNIVTQVLGTSFYINMDQDSKQVSVTVRTGRVQVYERAAPVTPDALPQKVEDGVTLSPNQKVVYTEALRQFETKLADTPMLVKDAHAGTSTLPGQVKDDPFVFRDARLATIIEVLKQQYQIDIEVGHERLNNCHFSGDVTGMSLYKKLDVICEAMNTSYEIKGTFILISGPGCN